ncbi:PapB/FocB family fimbrial expression transcriptional regulator [Idiomarina xiamenensis]|uniref:Uncharacterized protein n=1 Tax=Idiomarina xiamenensis 10-D-4 TaxID=740709 RepID=K2JV79_9GAMM|nr:PapB/FocB family fimbrial expression transcriptional regulator [Idiomarina xiamenensis]EKE79443.1 hypothetical protein A10D4_12784 [Idiomarina xiamenensis 10-D-4]
MKYLCQASQTNERFELLLQLTRINSDDVKDALRAHLVKGFNEKDAALLNGVPFSNFSRALTKLNHVAGVVESIKDIDWQRFKSDKR